MLNRTRSCLLVRNNWAVLISLFSLTQSTYVTSNGRLKQLSGGFWQFLHFVCFRLGSWFLQWLWAPVRWFGSSITSPLTIGSTLIVKDRLFSLSTTTFGTALELYSIKVLYIIYKLLLLLITSFQVDTSRLSYLRVVQVKEKCQWLSVVVWWSVSFGSLS